LCKKQAERAPRPGQPAAPTEHGTQAAHHRDNHVPVYTVIFTTDIFDTVVLGLRP